MPEIIEHDYREHRIPGRNSSGRIKPGVSGNPAGRPKGSKNKPKVPEGYVKSGEQAEAGGIFVKFEPVEGQDIQDVMEQNALRFANAAWKAVGNGNQRLAELAFAQLLKDKKAADPLKGLTDLFGQSPDELRRLAGEVLDG